MESQRVPALDGWKLTALQAGLPAGYLEAASGADTGTKAHKVLQYSRFNINTNYSCLDRSRIAFSTESKLPLTVVVLG